MLATELLVKINDLIRRYGDKDIVISTLEPVSYNNLDVQYDDPDDPDCNFFTIWIHNDNELLEGEHNG